MKYRKIFRHALSQIQTNLLIAIIFIQCTRAVGFQIFTLIDVYRTTLLHYIPSARERAIKLINFGSEKSSEGL